MPRKPLDDLIDRQREWLDPLAKTFARWTRQLGSSTGTVGARAYDILHGVWLGHPLHPVTTDIPVGAWTAAVAMDAVDTFVPNQGAKHAADAAVGIGILGGLMAAPAGIVDWHHLTSNDRRVGLVHGLLNVLVLTLFSISFFLRRGKARPAGVSLGMLAFSIASLSAYLGGELVFNKGVGVNRVAFDKTVKDFVPVAVEAELAENQPHKVMVDGMSVVLVKQGDRIHALRETCTHLGGPLAEGRLEGDVIVCPWHGSHFSLQDGSVVGGPATFAEVAYEARVVNGQVEVRPRN